MMRWALVTGAARRIGRAIALDLAAAGWNIVVHYHTSRDEAEQLARTIKGQGREVCLAEIDLADARALKNLIPRLTTELGPIMALVNNASMFEPDTYDPDGTRHQTVNIDAPRVLSETFYNLHKQASSMRTPATINLLDTAPIQPQFSAYNASKIALQRLTLVTARTYAPHVRVNGVALGPVMPSPRESPQHFQNMIDVTPMKSAIAPDSVASAVRFLIENAVITGEIVHVDGGMHLHAARIESDLA